MININEKQKSVKFRERAYSKIMFVFPLVKKLAQNMGTSYSGFGKTPKSKTCKRILREIYNKRVLHWKNLCNSGRNKYSSLMFVKLFFFLHADTRYDEKRRFLSALFYSPLN